MEQRTLEVTVFWGDTILEHARLSRDRSRRLRRLYARARRTRVAFSRGKLTYVVGLAGEHVPLEERRRWDWTYARVFVASTIAHAFFVATSMLTPPKQLFTSDAISRHWPRIPSVRLKEAPPRESQRGSRDGGAFTGEAGLIGEKDRSRAR